MVAGSNRTWTEFILLSWQYGHLGVERISALVMVEGAKATEEEMQHLLGCRECREMFDRLVTSREKRRK